MKCHHCNEYAPDDNYKCPHCGKVLKEDFDPAALKRKAVKKNRPIISPILLIVCLGLIIFLYIKYQPFNKKSEPTSSKTVTTTAVKETKKKTENTVLDESQEQQPSTENEDPVLEDQTEDFNSEEGEFIKPSAGTHIPGEEIDIEKLAEIGKTTIFDFYSDYCGPCRQISPLLERLDQKRRDIVVIKIDINRTGISTIDWASPVARQYKLGKIPYFIIYDVTGLLSHEGDAAYQQIGQLITQEGIR